MLYPIQAVVEGVQRKGGVIWEVLKIPVAFLSV